MIGLSTESQGLPVDDGMAFLAHVLALACCLHLGVALVAQGSSLVLDEPQVGQLFVAHLATETLRVPGGLHCLDDPPNDELATLAAARRKEDMEVVFTIFPALELIKHAIRKRPETLGADEAATVEEFSITVDYLGLGLEAVIAASASDTVQVHDAGHSCRSLWSSFLASSSGLL